MLTRLENVQYQHGRTWWKYNRHFKQASSVCALSELQRGGGQIVTTGAPQQFAVSIWKSWPNPPPTTLLPI